MVNVKLDHWSWFVSCDEAHTITGIDPDLAQRVYDACGLKSTYIANAVESGLISLADFIALNKTVRMGAACMYCGKSLTDPDSIKRGAGPVCAAEYGEEHDHDDE